MKLPQNLEVGGTGVFAGNVSVPNAISDAHAVNKVQMDAAIAGLGITRTEIVTVDFGSVYTDKKQIVLTGKTWITSTTAIVPHMLTPSDMDADEMYLYRFYPTISNRVDGVGYTLTIYTEAEYKGTIDVMVIAA